jgi:2-polyprenyl-3-methyl-5-hydroxy-6-metoxy-1,4-benzoquinol methylase
MDQQTKKELLGIVKNNYEAIASDFARDRNRLFWPELIKLIERLVPKEKTITVLDVGCGNGRLLKALPTGVKYLGLDNSAGLIKIASEQNPAPERASYQVANILELNKIKENNFDFVFCVAVLHHLPSSELRLEALKQLKSKLAPGGKLIITNWNLWSERKYRRLIWRFCFLRLFRQSHQMDFGDILFDWHGSKTPSRRYYHAFTKKELARLCKKAGVKIKQLYKDRLNYYLITSN